MAYLLEMRDKYRELPTITRDDVKEIIVNSTMERRSNYKKRRVILDEEKVIRNILYGIRSRCGNINDPRYKYYGGRGITVFNEWIDSAESFVDYVFEFLGNRPSMK